MPDTPQPQLDELRRRARRRLVGAIVLALAAAVLVPMLLESDPKPLGEDVSVKIPPVDNSKFVSKLGDKAKDAPPAKPAAPAPEPVKDAIKETAKETATATGAAPVAKSSIESDSRTSSPAAKPPAATSAPQESSAPAGTKGESASATANEATMSGSDPPKTGASAAAKSGGYSVQLAAFSDDKGANALAGKLKKAGHPAYTEPYTTSRGTLWRVRVGPYATRDAAEAARGKLKAEGQSGIIAQAN